MLHVIYKIKDTRSCRTAQL